MVFKQLLQAEAIDVCQIDSCRLAGVSEVLSVLLMAAKYRNLSFSGIFDTDMNGVSEDLVFPYVHMRVALGCANMSFI